jgi:hypothetical protein
MCDFEMVTPEEKEYMRVSVSLLCGVGAEQRNNMPRFLVV